ncbi:hypothetical protein ACOM2C_05075 [Pseudarthrobacter sp. So.54]
MSVAYVDAQGKNVQLRDKEDQRFAYHVAADSGVLLVMQKLNTDLWQVSKELSPNGWREVQGTRFNQFPTNSPGTDGRINFAPKPKTP